MTIDNTMDKVIDCMQQLKSEELKIILSDLLRTYLTPTFGAVKTAELDSAFLHALIRMGVLDEHPDLFDMLTVLKVTRPRARNLLYQMELRQLDMEDVNQRVKELLLKPTLEQEGKRIALDIDSPILMDALRAKVKKLGYLTDQSFSPSVVTLSQRAFVDLIVNLIPKESRSQARNALKDAGAKCRQEVTLNDLLGGIVGQVGASLAGQPGKVISKSFYYGLSDFASENFESAAAYFKDWFADSLG